MNRLRLHVKRRAQPFGEIFYGARDGANERRVEILSGFCRRKIAFMSKQVRKKTSKTA